MSARPGLSLALRLGLCLCLLTSTAAAVRADSGVWSDPRKIPIPPLSEIPIPSPERIVLGNGMIVYLLEDHDFPLVDVNALMRVGSIYEPADKVGLASITGEVMRSGGSQGIPGDSLDRTLESLGASVEINVGSTDGNASVSTLSADIDQGLRILADLLRRPALPEDKIELAKKQERTSIASRNDEPMSIAFREFTKLVYGPTHPYARHTEYATIDAITRDDLVRFHDEFFFPDRIIMTVYGDFNTAKVKKLLNGIFGDWPRSGQPLPPDPPVNPSGVTGLYLAPKADATNSLVVLGHVGMRMDDPDYPAMTLFNDILGGGFSGRLMNEIRTKRGLAYATGSDAGAGYHHPEMLLVFAATQVDSTSVTTGYVQKEVEKALNEPISQEEVDRARDITLNSLVKTLSSKGAVLNRLARYEFYGYPKDFLQKYQEAIRTLTPADVQAAAKRKVRPAEFATLIVGNKDKVEPGLEKMGSYKQIDITIPEAAGEAAPAGTEADFQRGQELLAAALKASGGTALEGLKDFTYEEKGSFTVQGMAIPVTGKTVRKLPDCERAEQTLPFGTVIQVVCGEKGWMKSPQGTDELPPDQLGEALSSQRHDLFTVLRSGKSLKIQALPGPADIDGHSASVALVRDEVVQGWKIFFDNESHRIVRMEYRDKNPATGAPGLLQEDFNDYKSVGGVQWPHARVLILDGEALATLNTTTASANSGVDEAVFAMPAQ